MEKFVSLAEKSQNPHQAFSFLKDVMGDINISKIIGILIIIGLIIFGIISIYFLDIAALFLLFSSTVFVVVVIWILRGKQKMLNNIRNAKHYYALKAYFSHIDYNIGSMRSGRATIRTHEFTLCFVTTPQSEEKPNRSIKKVIEEMPKVDADGFLYTAPQTFQVAVSTTEGDKYAIFLNEAQLPDKAAEIEFLLKFWTQSTLYIYFLEDGTRIALAEESEERARRLVASL